jgi:hypothetical protein
MLCMSELYQVITPLYRVRLSSPTVCPTTPRYMEVDVSASRLSKNPKTTLRFEELRMTLSSPSIADRQERLELWSGIARDDEERTVDRLRATELLGKSQGDFIERTESMNLNVHTIPPYLMGASLEELEEMLAEVRRQKRLVGGN